MSQLLITEEEKKSILDKYYPSQKLNEQWWKTLGKFVTGEVDDFARVFGKDAASKMDDLFFNAFRNTKNFVVQNGKNFLKSANPNTPAISMEALDAALKKVGNGQMTKEQLLNGVPRFLPDGTAFREKLSPVLDDLLAQNKKVATNVPKTPVSAPKQATGADYRAQVSQSQARYGGGSN